MKNSLIIEGYVSYPDYVNNDMFYYIDKIIKTKEMVQQGKFFYTICNVKSYEGYVYGLLLKISQSRREEYFDEEKWSPIEKEISERRVNISSRFLIFNDSTIIFEDVSAYLSKHTFRKAFIKLLHKAMKDEEIIFTLDINFKKSKKDILYFINNCDYITRIVFDGLKVPNPYKFNDENTKKAVRFIEELKIKKASLENKDDGINVNSPKINGLLNIVHNRGIGNSKIYGVKRQSPQYYNTKSKIKSKKIVYDGVKEFIKKCKKLKNDED